MLPRLKNIQWEIKLDPPLENLESNFDLLNMIFNNLIDNVLKYSEKEGKIRIAAKRQNESVLFLVQDEGRGIPLQEQDRIFERFYRGSHPPSQDDTGSGLGLSIVKHAVQALGGKVWVKSEPGKGSQFYFTVRNH